MNLNNKENNKLKIKNKELRLVLEMKENLKRRKAQLKARKQKNNKDYVK
jgi:hypothetical protein